MAENYKLLLQLLKKWPVDRSKGTRCYGYHLRELARKAFPTGNLFVGSDAENHKKLQSLLRLADNKYANEIPYRKKIGASGHSLTEIQIALSEEYINKNKGITRIKE